MARKHKAIVHALKVLGIIVTLMVSILLIVSAYGGHVNPQRSAIYALATLAFPIMLGITVVAALLWIVAGKWKISLILWASIIVSWPTVRTISPLNISSHHYTPEEEKTKFKVLTFNVLNFNVNWTKEDNINNKEGQKTVRYILEQDADVVLLQEASLNADYNDLRLMQPFMNQLKKKYPYRDHGYHDQVILSKHPYEVVEDPAVKGGFGSLDDPVNSYHFYARAYDVLVPGHKVRFINVHLKSIGLSADDKQVYMNLTNLKNVEDKNEMRAVKNSLLAKLSGAFRSHAEQASIIRQVIDQGGENVIICGDFNDTPASYAYRTIMGNDMSDAWVECGFGPIHTYHDNRFFFKIDHILYRGDMLATEIRRDKAGSSDHYPLVATFVWKK